MPKEKSNLSEKRKKLFKEIMKNCDYPADFVDYILRKVEEQDKHHIQNALKKLKEQVLIEENPITLSKFVDTIFLEEFGEDLI